MHRTFYVDAARSITSQTGKKYWKCSVVENEKNLINFANSKAQHSIEAEAYAILKTVFWLVEQKEQGGVIIYSDCSGLTGYRKMKKPKKGKSKASEFIFLAKAIAWKNNINLEIRWVKGKENPADYYSRHHAPKKPKALARGTSL